jgi:hypothetical protein
MEPISQIANRINLSPRSEKQQTPPSSETSRRIAIETAIRRIYTSARKAPPERGSATLEMETEEALRLWAEIPTEDIPVAVEEAIIEAGAFLATNGLVVKVWRGLDTLEAKQEDAQRAIRKANTERYLGRPSLESPETAQAHPEEVDKHMEKLRAQYPWMRRE